MHHSAKEHGVIAGVTIMILRRAKAVGLAVGKAFGNNMMNGNGKALTGLSPMTVGRGTIASLASKPGVSAATAIPNLK